MRKPWDKPDGIIFIYKKLQGGINMVRFNNYGKAMIDKFLKEKLYGFDDNATKDSGAYEKILQAKSKGEPLRVWDEGILILAHIFGTNGCEQNYDKALEMALELANKTLAKMSQQNDKTYRAWKIDYEICNTLLGTIFGLKQEWVKACYHFAQGNAFCLHFFYKALEEYAFNQLHGLKTSTKTMLGKGYSAQNHAGTDHEKFYEWIMSGVCIDPPRHRFCLSRYEQEQLEQRRYIEFIRSLKGKNGEVIVPSQDFIHLIGKEGDISIYEVCVIDKNYNIFKVNFYLYLDKYGLGQQFTILPDGFEC